MTNLLKKTTGYIASAKLSVTCLLLMAVIVFWELFTSHRRDSLRQGSGSIMVCTDTIQYTFPRDEADLTGSFTQRDIQLSEVFKAFKVFRPYTYSFRFSIVFTGILFHPDLHRNTICRSGRVRKYQVHIVLNNLKSPHSGQYFRSHRL